VVAAEELDAAALELAHQVASASSLILRIGKQAFYRQIDVAQDEAYDMMSETMAENAMTSDAQEGMSAFLQKRPPTWRGK
jgi:enoyl-CoA hydratase/carnithine racemase